MSTVQKIAITLVFLLGGWSTSFAGSGITISLPQVGIKPTSKMNVTIDTRWVDGWGYRPVTITLNRAANRADRTITVTLYPNSYSSSGPTPLSYTAEIEIPQGAMQASKTIYVPQRQTWSMMRVECREDGRRLRDLCMRGGMGNNQYYRNDESTPSILLVDRDAPRISERPTRLADLQRLRDKQQQENYDLPDAQKMQFLATGYQQYGRLTTANGLTLEMDDEVGRSSDLDSLKHLENMPGIELIPNAQVPDSNVGLTGVDLMVISLPDLLDLQQTHPARFDAVERFVFGGGNMLVYDQDDALFETLATVFRLRDPWQKPDRETYRSYRASWDEVLDDDNDVARGTRPRKVQKPSDSYFSEFPEFQTTTFGMGRIAATKTDQLFRQRRSYFQWVMTSLGNRRLSWTERHGISLTRDNDDYWDFMIPGFGKAPVKSFLGIICMFIVAVGPVNYFWLKKFRRLYLLPITVGLAALVTTFTMLSYALVSDGVSTKVRLRSYTYLDQTEDLATTYCRHAYLAAFAPSGGLVFPASTCVYPLMPSPEMMPSKAEAENERLGTRRLTRGYIRSRSNTQLLTTEVVKTDIELTVMPNSGDVAVKNQLGVDLQQVWLWDQQGILHRGSNVAPEETVTLKPWGVPELDRQIAAAEIAISGLADESEAALIKDRKDQIEQLKKQRVDLIETFDDELSKIIRDNQPKPPPGLDKTANKRSAISMFLGISFNRNSSPVDFTRGLMEEKISDIREFVKRPSPGSYFMITETAPTLVSTGTKARQEAGFHIIHGRWGAQ